MHCLCIIFTLSVCLSFVTGRETKQIPSTGFNKQGIFKPLAATGTIAGLFLGKRLIDGPVFNDAVSLKGKNVVITGANSGLGRATAEKLASLGANMYLFCKSPEKGDATVTEIRAKTGNNNVYNIPMDLRSLKSVATAAKELGDRLDNVHILVNNAGVMALPKRTETEDGFEAHLGINHLGHFAFTGQILPLLMKDDNTDSSPKRIVSVASAAHYFGKIDRDNLMLTKPGSYEPWPAYGNSKQANILFTTALAKKLQSLNQDPARKTQIIAACCHPGVCRTELGRYAFDLSQLPAYLNPLLTVALSPAFYFTKSSEQGAQTQIYLAASERVTIRDAGKYFDNSAPATPYSNSVDPNLAQWLWQESEKLTGVRYAI